jgi:hypothetical protein
MIKMITIKVIAPQPIPQPMSHFFVVLEEPCLTFSKAILLLTVF